MLTPVQCVVMGFRYVTLLLLFVFAACTFAHPTSALSRSPASMQQIPATNSRWTHGDSNGFPLETVAQVMMTADVFAAIGSNAILVGSAKTGAVWRRAGTYSSGDVADGAVFLVNVAGDVMRLRASDGAQLWETRSACETHGSHYIRRIKDDIFVGCASGRLVRIRSKDGAVLAHALSMAVERYSEIRSLPSDTLSLTGWASGAYLQYFLSIVRRTDLSTILRQREDVSLVGTVGSTAVLNDTCCMGRPDVYRPATIIRVALPSGRMSEPVDLRPDPQLFPADKRPIGQGAIAMISGRELYLAVPPMLYDYGYPGLFSSSPTRILDTLDSLPTILAEGYLFVRVRANDNKLTDELLDLRRKDPIIWSAPTTDIAADLKYDARSAPDVIAVPGTEPAGGTIFVRAPDGAVLITRDTCGSFASDDRYVVAVCSKNTGAHRKLYLGAFLFPNRFPRAAY